MAGHDESGSADTSTDGAESAFAADLAKILIADSLQFLRGQVQTLQAVLGLLLTGYVGLLVAVWNQAEIDLGATTSIASFAPVALFAASLSVLLGRAALYPGSSVVLGSVESAVDAYDKALAIRRAQLVLPGILGLLGVVAGMGALLYLIQHG